jgi:hypothetical protein
METLSNCEIKFVLATLKELHLATLKDFLPGVTHCSVRVCVLVIVFSEIPCEIVGKWETCPILK